jgi:hypothetical protein
VAETSLAHVEPEVRPEVILTDFDPEGEVKVIAAALYPTSGLPDDQLLTLARQMSPEERAVLLQAYVGRRANRRHKPGRAFERTAYRFDVLTDYGAFRDLQRHRMLTLEWQPLSPKYGYSIPEAIDLVGAGGEWRRVMDASADLHDALVAGGLGAVASYAVCMAYRMRFYMEMNAREAMHVLELRTALQGHPAYRRVCQEMHRLIAEGAGHRAIAEAMRFVDHSAVELERLEGERRTGARRRVLEQRRIKIESVVQSQPAHAAGIDRHFDDATLGSISWRAETPAEGVTPRNTWRLLYYPHLMSAHRITVQESPAGDR